MAALKFRFESLCKLAPTMFCAMLLVGASGAASAAPPSGLSSALLRTAPTPSLQLSQMSVANALLNENGHGWTANANVNFRLVPRPAGFPGPARGIGHYSIETQVASSTSCTNVFGNVANQRITDVGSAYFEFVMTTGYWHLASAIPCATSVAVYLQTAYGVVRVSNFVTLQNTFTADLSGPNGATLENVQRYLPVMGLHYATGAVAAAGLSYGVSYWQITLATVPSGFPGPASGSGHYLLKTQITMSPGCSNVFGTIFGQDLVDLRAAGANIDGTPSYLFNATVETGPFALNNYTANPAICPATVALFVQRGASVVQVSNAVPLAITLQFSGGSWMLSGEE